MTALRAAESQPVIPVMRPVLGEEEAAAVAEVLASGWVAQGPRVAAFESAFAASVGAEHAVAVSSCTAALHLALALLDLQPGDEVVIPSLSFIATANAVRYVGATPVFADVELATGNLTVDTVAEVLSPRTRAVLAVHQAGVPLDLEPLFALLDPIGVRLIEDAACAAGVTYRGAPVGGGRSLATFSFHPRKLLTTGEGGMLTTDSADEARRARRLREHGMSVSAAERHAAGKGGALIETYDEVGFNYRMTDLQAAVGLVQLDRLPGIVARRREIAARYRSLLDGVAGLRCVAEPAYGTGNAQGFWVLLPEGSPIGRNDLLGLLAESGISARRGVMAAHLEPAYADTPLRVSLPNTERLTADSLVLPIHHGMIEADQDRVVGVVLSALSALAS